MWVIVKFTHEKIDYVEVVPSSWTNKQKSECFWPITEANLSDLVTHNSAPNTKEFKILKDVRIYNTTFSKSYNTLGLI